METNAFHKFYFCLSGVTALVAWNSILTAEDFFDQ